MKKVFITLVCFCSALLVSAQQSQADRCEIIAQEAGCAAFENGLTDWEGHYAIIDSVYETCMSR